MTFYTKSWAGIGIIGGAVGGALAGGVLCAFFKKSANLTKEDIETIDEELGDGKAAVVATVDEFEIDLTREKIESLGGKTYHFPVPAEALDEVAKQMDMDGEEESEGEVSEEA